MDYRRVFEHVRGRVLVIRTDSDWTIAGASDAYLRTHFLRREDVVDQPLFEVVRRHRLLPPDTTEHLRSSLARVVASRVPDAMDAFEPSADGLIAPNTLRRWRATNTPLTRDNGEVELILHETEDITELALLQRTGEAERTKLIEANHRFQAIYDQGLFAGRLDLSGIVLDANRSSLAQCGFTREEVIGRPFWECGWWNRSRDVQRWVQGAVMEAASGKPFRGESEYFWADGTRRIVDFSCMPIRDEDGRVTLLVPTGMDITERVDTEGKLRVSEVLDSIAEGFFTLDREWRFQFVNRKALRILARTSSELRGRALWDVFPDQEGSELAESYEHAMQIGETRSFTASYLLRGRWYSVTAYPGVHGIAVYFRDVTEQKNAESERQRLVAESERQKRIYEAALSNTPDLVYVFGLDHRFIYANEALLKMWGVTREEALTKNWQELGYELWHSAMHDREIDHVIATGMPVRGEVPFNGTEGRRIYDYIFVPVFGPDGSVVAVAGTTRDITERQEAEQAIREQAARLVEADRAKDEFLATLSHELRNPLAPLRNSLSLLRLDASHGNGNERILERMDRQLDHLVRLVDDLLEVSRITSGSFSLRNERVDVASVVRTAIETSSPLIDSAAHGLTVGLPDTPLWLHGDPVRIAQILSNLLNNAARYTDRGGNIRIEAEALDGMAEIRVIDNGSGIAPEVVPRLFQMFSRGDHAFGRGESGLGIGLALARRLAEMHDGTLDVRSDGRGRGSTFRLRLPFADETAVAARTPSPAPLDLGGLQVLVVDDNRDAADTLAMLLRFLGVEVQVAHDGASALLRLATFEPHVVLLDIGMPSMDGYQVARAIRERFPNYRTALVALTGWGQEEDRVRARDAGFDRHMVKPVEMDELQALLASMFAAARGKTTDDEATPLERPLR